MRESLYINMNFVCRQGSEHAGAIDYARPLSVKLGRGSCATVALCERLMAKQVEGGAHTSRCAVFSGSVSRPLGDVDLSPAYQQRIGEKRSSK